MSKKSLDRFDKTAKKNVPLKIKVVGLISGCVLISAVLVCAISLLIFEKGFVSNTRFELKNTCRGVSFTLSDWVDNLLTYANFLGEDSVLDEAIENDDVATLNDFINDNAEDFGVDILAVADTNGNILSGVGTGNVKSVASHKLFKSALKNKVSYSYTEFGESDFAQLVMAPLFNSDEEIIGCIVVGYDLSAESNFLV